MGRDNDSNGNKISVYTLVGWVQDISWRVAALGRHTDLRAGFFLGWHGPRQAEKGTESDGKQSLYRFSFVSDDSGTCENDEETRGIKFLCQRKKKKNEEKRFVYFFFK